MPSLHARVAAAKQAHSQGHAMHKTHTVHKPKKVGGAITEAKKRGQKKHAPIATHKLLTIHVHK